MNNPTSTKKSSTPSKPNRAESARKRIKASAEDRVEAQLARLEASGEAESGVNYDGPSNPLPLKLPLAESLPSCLWNRLRQRKPLMNSSPVLTPR
jgi:hypothetical protein